MWIAQIAKKHGLIDCVDALFSYPQETEEIIMDWAKENPIVTNADKVREVLGLSKEEFNPSVLCAGIKCVGRICEECPRKEFWNQEWKEPQEKANE